MVMLRLWLNSTGDRSTSGNDLEKALRAVGREDIVEKCIFNVEMVTDEVEKSLAKTQMEESGFGAFKVRIITVIKSN